MEYNSYVSGLLFDDTGSKVLLIKKPDGWHGAKGRWNSVGGKWLAGSFSPRESMSKRFGELTGFQVHKTNWTKFLELRGSDFEVHFFTYFSSKVLEQLSLGNIGKIATRDTGELAVVLTDQLPLYVVPDVPWIVSTAKHHAQDFTMRGKYYMVRVESPNANDSRSASFRGIATGTSTGIATGNVTGTDMSTMNMGDTQIKDDVTPPLDDQSYDFGYLPHRMPKTDTPTDPHEAVYKAAMKYASSGNIQELRNDICAGVNAGLQAANADASHEKRRQEAITWINNHNQSNDPIYRDFISAAERKEDATIRLNEHKTVGPVDERYIGAIKHRSEERIQKSIPSTFETWADAYMELLKLFHQMNLRPYTSYMGVVNDATGYPQLGMCFNFPSDVVIEQTTCDRIKRVIEDRVFGFGKERTDVIQHNAQKDDNLVRPIVKFEATYTPGYQPDGKDHLEVTVNVPGHRVLRNLIHG